MVAYAIDPGPHTGIFFLKDNIPQRVTLDYTDGLIKEPHAHLYRWLIEKVDPDEDRVIYESFEFRKEDAHEREYIDYSTGEFVGVIALYCQMTGVANNRQTASMAKGFWDDDKLRRVGFWIPGRHARHVRDATRHWLHHKTFTEGNNTWVRMLK